MVGVAKGPLQLPRGLWDVSCSPWAAAFTRATETHGCRCLLAASAASGWCDRETLQKAARAGPLLRRFGACVLLGARRGGGEGKGKLCTLRMLSAVIARRVCSGVSNGFPKRS